MNFTCWIPGTIPAKKNNWKPARGRIITDPAAKAQIDGITMLLFAEYRNARRCEPIAAFSISMGLYVSNLGSTDPDNAITTILDCLRAAGVIVNDNPKHSRQGSWSVIECEPGLEGAHVVVHALQA